MKLTKHDLTIYLIDCKGLSFEDTVEMTGQEMESYIKQTNSWQECLEFSKPITL